LNGLSENLQKNVGKRKGDKEGGQKGGEEGLLKNIEEVPLDQKNKEEERDK
jgi:hypothetical protein